LIWNQILSHAKSANLKSVIFITDDGKEDWWKILESDGPKKIGPRPELKDEARKLSSIESFLMYSPESFLQYAREFLRAQVSDETLKEVRDISTTKSLGEKRFQNLIKMVSKAEDCVLQWLEPQFDSVEHRRTGFPDFVAHRGEETYGFEVKVVQLPGMIIHRLRESIYRSYYELKERGFTELAIICIVNNVSDVEEVKRIVRRQFRDEMSVNLRIIIGVLVNQDIECGEFVPYEDFLFSRRNGG
jgi:hypothetical protein